MCRAGAAFVLLKVKSVDKPACGRIGFGPFNQELPRKVLAGFIVVAAFGSLVSTAAVAREIPAACQRDAAALCPGMAPGDHKFGKCMKEHEGQVSSGCKEAARELRKERGAGHQHGGMGSTGTPQPGLPSSNQ